MNWDDLRYLLAVAQSGSLKGAARSLGADKTTVSRRLQALERALGQPVVERTGGNLVLSDFGTSLLPQAEAMQDAAQAVHAQAQSGPVSSLGMVRVTSVPLIVNHLLLPALPEFLEQNPGLQVELISDSRDLRLLRGEADIALRLARPGEGGSGILTRKYGRLDYAAYAARQAGPDLPWIGYDRQMQYLPQAAALSRVMKGETPFAARFNDAEGLLQAVLAGLGKTLLPRLIGDRHPGLTEVGFPGAPPPGRDLWLMIRRDLRELERIRRCVDWIDGLLRPVAS